MNQEKISASSRSLALVVSHDQGSRQDRRGQQKHPQKLPGMERVIPNERPQQPGTGAGRA
jgi:hypothetical protein